MTGRPSPETMAQLRKAIAKQFAAYITPDSGPMICMDFEGSGPAWPAVVWEEGPFEWAHLAASGGIDEEMASLMAEFGVTPKPHEPVAVPAGWFIECRTSWAVSLYRADAAMNDPAVRAAAIASVIEGDPR